MIESSETPAKKKSRINQVTKITVDHKSGKTSLEVSSDKDTDKEESNSVPKLLLG